MQNLCAPAKQITLVINGKRYVLASFLTINDVIMLTDYLTSGKKNYCRAVATLIHDKIICGKKQRPSVNQIAAQGDSFFASYVNSLLERDDKLKSSFNNIAINDNICYRLILSVDNEWKSLATEMQQIKFPDLNIANVKNSCITFSSEITAASKFISNIADAFIDSFKKLGEQIKDFLSEIEIPSLSEEEKLETLKSFQQWGEYGWTCIPHGTPSYYNQSPKSQNSANKLALSMCGTHVMEELFDILGKTKGIKKSDLDEAIFDFRSKKYKSCSMIIFSMIDSKLIRLQRDEDRNPKTKRRYSGNSAAMKLQKHIHDEHNMEHKFFLLLVYENLFACINKVFEDGHDFKNQPSVINRNFIDHGMLTKSVIRKDCVQLFLLYYNLIGFLKIITD